MLMKRIAGTAALMVACLIPVAASQASIISGWDQNHNELASPPNASGLFGFTAASFPQASDQGPISGSHTINPVDTTVDINGNYLNVQSFAGSTVNDLAGAGAGGSFSFVGNQSNGSSEVFAVPTTGYSSINVSWSQRGTATGFTSRKFEYSTDGTTFTDFGPFTGSSGALSATFTTVTINLASIAGLNNNPNVKFRLTYDGATSGSGNNRWDNFYVQGVPEPATLALAGLGAIGCVGLVRRKK